MTFYRDFYDDECCSLFDCDNFYGFGGLNGYQFGSPYGFYRDQYRFGSPFNYRSFGNLYGNRHLTGYGGYDGCGDLYGFGYGYPFSFRFGNRFGSQRHWSPC